MIIIFLAVWFVLGGICLFAALKGPAEKDNYSLEKHPLMAAIIYLLIGPIILALAVVGAFKLLINKNKERKKNQND